jgi:hypothetical protein
MSAQTHVEQVLTHLKRGQPITPVEALKRYGCFRLGARIYDLKQRGHHIEKQMIEVETRGGGTARIAEYRLMSNG